MAKPEPNRNRDYGVLSELHVVLAKAFPSWRTADYSVFDVAKLAKNLKMTEEGVRKWLRANELPTMERARQIVKIKDCRCQLKTLLPFVK